MLKEQFKAVFILISLTWIGSVFPLSASAQITNGDAQISASVFGSPLVIKTAQKYAGAVYSLTWQGHQWVTDYQHGTQLQSAVFWDNWGGCWNPTEAGSNRDDVGPTSSSRLLSMSAVNNKLTSVIQMANWLQPNEPDPWKCTTAGVSHGLYAPSFSTILSDDTIKKQITIGFAQIPNVIEYLNTFHAAANHLTGTFSSPIYYMPDNFSSFWTYDANPLVNTLKSIDSSLVGFAPLRFQLPVILSTPNGLYAMGVYSPDFRSDGSYARDVPLPGGVYPVKPSQWAYIVNKFVPQKTNALQTVYIKDSPSAGDYFLRSYFVIGNIKQVKQGLARVYQYFNDDVLGFIEGMSVVNGQYNLTGWACARGSNSPITVNLYFGNPSSGGTKSATVLANLASTPDIATQCHATGSNYRFSIPIPQNTLLQYKDQLIYVQSTSSLAKSFLLAGSGFDTPKSFVANKVPVFRFWNAAAKAHFYTLNEAEGLNAGLQEEDGGFQVFDKTSFFTNMAPLYRCAILANGKQFISRDATCEAQRMVGTLGFVSTFPDVATATAGNSVALYRLFNPTTGDHLETKDPNEVTAAQAAGYRVDGNLGGVPTY